MPRFVSTYLFIFLAGVLLLEACQTSSPTTLLTPTRAYRTKQVVLVVIDGVRYSDSWGDSSFQNIPFMAHQLAPQCFSLPFFQPGRHVYQPRPRGPDYRHYQRLRNNGSEEPKYPSVFHYFREQTKAPASKAWIIASKDKLEILARTESPDPAAAFAPAVNAGNSGIGTGYRHDTTTLRVAKGLLAQHTPQLVLINLRGPDSEAHAGNWHGYLEAIRQSDQLVFDLWQWLQAHPTYQNTTTLLVTNDHGRHLGSRFKEHGDSCEGCRHISLLVLGPDVKPGHIATQTRSQVDVAATMAELLGIPVPKRDGVPMLELFRPE
ncbi:sulfatase-like hydrolase/transferase [Rufibacter ruber]|uniref:sulfatase-like hydrolase/transferase n=1 Tax=Rufibacter ruber TaxID=1783499 RepID=UPI0009ECE0F8|nr:sulfatase-like hydrolase/transferase [Rufibacter ruber]